MEMQHLLFRTGAAPVAKQAFFFFSAAHPVKGSLYVSAHKLHLSVIPLARNGISQERLEPVYGEGCGKEKREADRLLSRAALSNG